MQDFRDYYESLGVAQNATADELKMAYRRAARRYHPDLNPGDETAEEKFKEIGEAYEILSDSDRRSEYDQFTQFIEDQKNPKKGLFNRAKKSTKDYSQFKDFSMFVDYLLSRRGTANSPAPAPSPTPSSPPSSTNNPSASPPQSQPSPTPSTAKSSSTPSPSVPSSSTPSKTARRSSTTGRPTPSPSPQSSRGYASPSPAAPPSKPTPTPSQERNRKNPKSKIQNPKSPHTSSPPPPPSLITEAQLTLPLNKAYKGGKERIRLADGRSLTVTLPQGMLSGQTVQVTAHEPSGDRLSLLIQVAPHDFFTLDMPNVHCTIPITPSEAILGGPVTIPTLEGSVKMVVPAGARSGQKLRLPSKGYLFNGQRGDQIVELEIQMPTTVTARERELYEKIRLTESFRPRKNLYF